MDREEEIDWSEPETLKSKCEKAGLSYGAVITRINVLDWPLERALTTPVREKTRTLTFAGQTKSAAEWAAGLGLSKGAINQRLWKGWSLKRALTTPLMTTNKTRSLKARALAASLNYGTVLHRIHKMGWSEERALTAPPVARPEVFRCSLDTRITLNGQERSLRAWARHLGIHRNTLYRRIERGWSVERAITQPLQKHSARRRPPQ